MIVLDLDEVSKLFVEGITVREITRRLNVSKATLYRRLSQRGIQLQTLAKEATGTKRPSVKGLRNPNWKTDTVSAKTGYSRAWRTFLVPEGYQRHHRDRNPLNNEPSNIDIVSPRQHMVIDGRLERLIHFNQRPGRFMSPEAREKIRLARLGTKASPEARLRMSLTHRTLVRRRKP